MTPLEIEILLHYYTRAAGDYRDGDFSAPAVKDVIDWFKGSLLEDNPDDAGTAYRITDRGRAYIEALTDVQLPIQKWVMPD